MNLIEVLLESINESRNRNPAAHIPVIKNCPCLNCSVRRYVKEKDGITLAEVEEIEKGRSAYEAIAESLEGFRKGESKGYMYARDRATDAVEGEMSLSQTCEAAASTAEKIGRVKVAEACRALGVFSRAYLPIIQAAHDELKAAFDKAESDRDQAEREHGVTGEDAAQV